MGDYLLDIDRIGLVSGLYLLDITFFMDNGDTYTVQVKISEGGAMLTDIGTVYLLLLDAISREVIVQTQVVLDAASISFSIGNVPDGNYIIYAGTDFDGDRMIDDSELLCADGGTTTPTIHTVTRGIDITGITCSLGSTTGSAVNLVD